MRVIQKLEMRICCKKCKCVFEYEESDVRKGGGSGGKHKPRQFLCVDCPICKNIIEVWSDKE